MKKMSFLPINGPLALIKEEKIKDLTPRTKKNCERSSKGLKLDLFYDPTIPVLGIYPKEMKTGYQKYICTPMFITTLFTIVKIWGGNCQEMNKENVCVCVCVMECYSATRKKETTIQDNMDLEGVMLSEIRHTKKDKYCMISLIISKNTLPYMVI